MCVGFLGSSGAALNRPDDGTRTEGVSHAVQLMSPRRGMYRIGMSMFFVLLFGQGVLMLLGMD